MAKSRLSKSRASKAKCGCSFPQLILAAVLMTIGLWLLVGGFATQFKAAMAFEATVVVMYFVGLLFMFFGKFAAWKSHSNCTIHIK